MQVNAISANPTPAAATGAASTSSNGIDWGRAALEEAVATISNASGKYSLDQQLAAYHWIVNLAKTGPAPGQSDVAFTTQAQAALAALSPPKSDAIQRLLAAAAGQNGAAPPVASNATGAAQGAGAPGAVVDTRA